MKKTILVLVLIVAITGCTTETPDITTTIQPITYIVEGITENVSVQTIIPPGADPHTYEATPSKVNAITNSKTHISIGLGFAGFEERLLQRRANPAIIASEHLDLVRGEPHSHEEEHAEVHAEEHHEVDLHEEKH